MQGEQILQTIAEVSVAFAGFTGVVLAFGRRSDRAWSPMDVYPAAHSGLGACVTARAAAGVECRRLDN